MRLAAQEGGPGEMVAVGRGLDAVGLEDLPDSGGRNLDSQGGEFTVDSPVAPAGVLARQAQNKGSDAADGGTSTGSLGVRDSGVAAAQQVAVPAQDGVGGDDQGEPSQRWSGDDVEQSGEKRSVRWSEPGFVDLALQDGELVAQRQDFDVFVGVAHRQ
jgi:hypothetical protein